MGKIQLFKKFQNSSNQGHVHKLLNIWQIWFRMKTILNILLGDFATDLFHNTLQNSNAICWISVFKSLTLQLQKITSQLLWWIYGNCTWWGGLPAGLINHYSEWIKTRTEKFICKYSTKQLKWTRFSIITNTTFVRSFSSVIPPSPDMYTQWHLGKREFQLQT